MGSRSNHHIFFDQWNDHLVLHGGFENGKPSTETWRFDFTTRMWTQFPSAPAPSLTATFVDTILYSISGDSDVHGSIHFMKTESPEGHPSALEWTSIDFPTSPLTPGPRPRVGSALIPVATGYGRHYLLYLLGSRKGAGVTSSDETYTEDHPFYSDMWSIQVSSADFSPSRIKDAIRDNLPFTDSGAFKWYELEIAPTELTESSGKVHPGPRGFFGADACLDGKGVVLWGGLNAKGETEGDGWLLKIG
ncbi:hypothetical protein NM208_g7966 [Fusarium decemcellulare]|uniref:Uncharacterized protein n=1 Tax=Fusarium decemcellulare TaxID=57161 RepID=A0ACC1S714_9HYPO|nr:hypothetical protein NM208_g7966 [Fusarium decemcellulare]